MSVVSTILLIIDFVGGLVYINCSIGLQVFIAHMHDMPYFLWVISCIALGLFVFLFTKMLSSFNNNNDDWKYYGSYIPTKVDLIVVFGTLALISIWML